MGEREDLLQHFESLRATLNAAIEGLSPEQMTDPTIDGWSVKDHLLHIAAWDDIRASEVERISAGHATAYKMTPEHDEALNDLQYAIRKDLGLDQALWELQRSRERLIAAIKGATPRGLDASLYGEAGLRTRHGEEHAAWIRRWRGEKGY